MSKIESRSAVIKASPEQVFEKFSDFRNLSPYFSNSSDAQACTADELSFNIQGIGQISLRIKEKKSNSLIRIESSDNFPVSCNFQIYISEEGQNSNVKLLVEVGGNPLMASFLKGTIANFANAFIEKIENIPFECQI